MFRQLKPLLGLNQRTRSDIEVGSQHLRKQPALTRTRSWRGAVQLRFDDGKVEGKQVLKILVFSPIKAGLLFVGATTMVYMMMGHDYFMHEVYGYESEMHYEGKVNPPPDKSTPPVKYYTTRTFSNLHKLEIGKFAKKTFDIFSPSKQ